MKTFEEMVIGFAEDLKPGHIEKRRQEIKRIFDEVRKNINRSPYDNKTMIRINRLLDMAGFPKL